MPQVSARLLLLVLCELVPAVICSGFGQTEGGDLQLQDSAHDDAFSQSAVRAAPAHQHNESFLGFLLRPPFWLLGCGSAMWVVWRVLVCGGGCLSGLFISPSSATASVA